MSLRVPALERFAIFLLAVCQLAQETFLYRGVAILGPLNRCCTTVKFRALIHFRLPPVTWSQPYLRTDAPVRFWRPASFSPISKQDRIAVLGSENRPWKWSLSASVWGSFPEWMSSNFANCTCPRGMRSDVNLSTAKRVWRDSSSNETEVDDVECPNLS